MCKVGAIWLGVGIVLLVLSFIAFMPSVFG